MIRLRRNAPAILAAIAAASLGGCSPLGAAASHPRESKLAQAQATHEYPSPPPPPEHVAATSGSAEQAVRVFAEGYINWSAGTVSAQMRKLAAASVGQARSVAELEATQAGGDYELQRGGIANQGRVEAVAPLAGSGGRYVVVTREQTTATLTTAYQGLRPAWHVAIATVTFIAGGWVVSGWQPES